MFIVSAVCAHRARTSFESICAAAVFATACLWLIAAPRVSHAQAALSLPDALDIAVARSRQVDAQDQSIIAMKEMGVAAGQLPDPVLKLGIDNVPADGPDRFSVARDFMTMRRIGVMQEITRSDKRKLKAERYEREADRAAAEKSAAIAILHKDTAVAWLDRYYLERMRGVVVSQAQEANLEIQSAESAYRAGRGSQVDVYSARASRVALDDRLSELDRKLKNTNTMLERWIGIAVQLPLGGAPDISKVPLAGHSLEQDIEGHPEIAMLARQVAIAQTETELARANKQADWSVEVAYQQRGPAYSNMFSVGVSVPLQWNAKNRQDREVASKTALTQRAQAQQQDMVRAHVAEVRSMLNEWDNGRERVARYERELVPLAKDRTEAALAAYRGGKSDLSSVLAARRNEIEVRTQTLQLEMETARIWAQLNYLLPEGHGGQNATPAKEAK
jgi:outer membrane protein TolC